jgi:splicing factor U2AF 65 kDa subunit
MAEICRFGAVKSVKLVEHLSGSDNTAEGNMLQPEDKSIKIEPTELHHHDSSTEAASECSVPNQNVDVPYDSDSAWKDVDPTPEGLGQKDLPSNAALCDGHAPGADLDGIQERSAHPTLQQVEVDDKVPEASTDEDKHMEAAEATALVDDDAVEKGRVESIGTETCRSAAFGDEAEKSGRENKQLGADEDHKVKAPVVQMGVGAFVFEPGSVLVEFTREEAACMAAHSLHGRLFGNRTVSVRYTPHDLYLQKYPR